MTLAEVRRFMDRFKALLATQGANRALYPEIAEKIEMYGNLCAEVNTSLREVNGMIRRGATREALAIASREPPLLDLAGLLDIPEAATLPDVAGAVQTHEPELLLLDYVAEIQDAFARGPGAGNVADELHRMVLAGSPLPNRIAAMRELEQMNPSEEHWDADIRAAEKAWFQVALEECRRWTSVGASGAIAAALADLKNAGYRERPAPALLTTLHRLATEAYAAELPELAQAIDQVAAQDDWPRGKEMFDRYRQLAKQLAEAGSKKPLPQLAPQTRRWIEEQELADQRDERIRLAGAALRRTLAHPKATAGALTNGWRDYAAMGGRDQDLAQGIADRLAAMRRQQTIVVVSVVGGVLVVLLLLAAVLLRGGGRSAARPCGLG